MCMRVRERRLLCRQQCCTCCLYFSADFCCAGQGLRRRGPVIWKDLTLVSPTPPSTLLPIALPFCLALKPKGDMKQHHLNRSLRKLRSAEVLLSKYYDSSHPAPILSPAIRTQTASNVFFGGILNNRNDPKTRKVRTTPVPKQQSLPATHRLQSSPRPPLVLSPQPLFAELLLGPEKPTTPKPQLLHRKAPLRSSHLHSPIPLEPQMYLGPVILSPRPVRHTGSGERKSEASLFLERLVRAQASRRYVHTRSTVHIPPPKAGAETCKDRLRPTAEICLPIVHAISTS